MSTLRTASPRLIAIAIAALVAAFAFAASAQATTYTVSDASDRADFDTDDGNCEHFAEPSGGCSLRAAIQQANAHAGFDEIEFGIFTGDTVIDVQTALPAITDPVRVDGETQDGYESGAPVVQVDGTAAPSGNGLSVTGGGTTIRALAIVDAKGHGIELSGAGGNVVELSRIVGNGGDGVAVLSGAGNRIRENYVNANGGLGIDVAPDGVTAAGLPEILAATTDGTATTVIGRVRGTANTAIDVHLFTSPQCDPSGHGEGAEYRATTTAQTNAFGEGRFETVFPGALPVGAPITATATPASGSTSEFSQCFAARPVPAVSIADSTAGEGAGSVSFTVSLSESTTGDTSVEYGTGDGTAKEPGDYGAVHGALVIPAGETTRTVDVAVVSDAADEPDETFVVKLNTAGPVADGEAIGTIRDDDRDEVVLDFEKIAHLARVTDRYASEGLVFGQGPDGAQGGVPTVTDAGPLARSGSKVAKTVNCQQGDVKLCHNVVWGAFEDARSLLRVHVGVGSRAGRENLAPDPAVFRLRAYDGQGDSVGGDTQGVAYSGNTGFTLEVRTDSPRISFFRLAADEPSARFDDVTFDRVEGGKSQRDFRLVADASQATLTPGGALPVAKGSSLSTRLEIKRLNGSVGPLDFSVSQLPPGVTAQFSGHLPSETDPRSVVLRVAATTSAADVTDRPVVVTATPRIPAAGGSPRSLAFRLTVRGQHDARATAIEVTQGIQTNPIAFDEDADATTRPAGLPGRLPGNPTAAVPYFGVRLVRGGRTIARVYADDGRPGQVAGVGAALYGYDALGRPLPQSPLTPVEGERTLRHGPGFATLAQRTDPAGAFTFTLPASWTMRGPIRLRAKLLAPEVLFENVGGECAAAACRQNNTFDLKSVVFHRSRSVTVTPVRVTYSSEGDPVPGDPATVLEQARNLSPLADGGLTVQPYAGTIDATEAVNTYFETIPELYRLIYPYDPAKSDRYTYEVRYRDRFVMRVLEHFMALPGIKLGNYTMAMQTIGFGLARGDAHPGRRSVVNVDRPFTSVAHELFHNYGRKHAAAACGAKGEDWKPDQQGWIHGVGLDRRAGSGGSAGPYAIKAYPSPSLTADGLKPSGAFAGQWYDLMSYCAYEEDAWISDRGWDASQISLSAAQTRAATPRAAADASALRVTALLEESTDSASITSVQGAEGPGEGEASPYRLVARDAGGAVLSDGPMAIVRGHDHQGEDALLSGDAVAAAARVEIVRDGRLLAARDRSAATPQVGSVRVAGAAVTWTSGDTDGGELIATVDASSDDGRTWRRVFAGPDRGRASVPAYLVDPSRRARMRVRVNDGFSEAEAVSVRFEALGAPPMVRVTSPSAGARMAADASVYLSGEAFEGRERKLRGRRLAWFDGGRRIGRGERITVTGLTPGRRTLRLVARDSRGRKGSASVAIVVRPVAPKFLELSAKRAGGRVRLRVASSLRARLTAGGRRFRVGRRAKSVSVPLRRNAKQVRLTLRAGGKVTRTLVVL